ncbi:MAG TPA: IS66 family transposase [Burkholderiales bacterium]|nr:IS66 family transposase [Burkholderiales bacterium]
MNNTEDEPNELERLRAQLTQLSAQHHALADAHEATVAELRVVRTERDLYKEQLSAAQRRLFAAKSEARGSEQKDLFFNEAEALAPTRVKRIAVPAHERAKRGRKPLDAGLPREVIRHELPEAERCCPHDGAQLMEIGVEVAEQLDIIPAQIRVLRHERVKYACPCCERTLRTAPAPERLIPKGQLSEAALAWIITAKYQDGLPLYRQAALLNRFGGDLNRQSLAGNVIRAAQAVQPLINLLRDRLFEAPIIAGDETELQVLKEPGRAAQRKSYLWVQVSGIAGSGPPIRLFAYEPSRSAQAAQRLYAGIAKGTVLLSDGYEVYDCIAHSNQLLHLGCWAHARRGFVEAEAALPKAARSAEQPATQFVAAIAELYAIEQRAREHQLNLVQHSELRQEHSRVALAHIEALLQRHLHRVLPNSLLGKALHYLAGQWPKLTRFVDDARYPLDNNLTENAIRPFVIGRRNWLFSDTVAGATASANLYSLIETAKANRRDPYRYLVWLFTRLPSARSAEDYEALLPWHFTQAPQ